MAGWRKPGPHHSGDQHDVIDKGTLCRQLSPKPGPICATQLSQSSTGTGPARWVGSKQASLPLLRQGEHGDIVTKLQSFLNLRLDLRPPLRVDGNFDPVTGKAVVDFQTSRSIKPDGEVGKTTWYHLIAGTPAKLIPTKAPVPPPGMAGATAAPKPSFPHWQPPPDSVMDWSLQKKLEYVVGKVPSNLPTQLRTQIIGLMHAQSTAIKLEAMAYSELFDVGREGGHAKIATTGGQAIFELMNPTKTTALATTQAELDKAVADLAETIKKMGVTEVVGALAKCRLVEVGGTTQKESAAPAPDETPPPKPQRSAPPEAPPEEPVFQPNINAAVMAAAMQSAAQSGKPFCLE